MRIHASGVGDTFAAAMEDLGDELDTASAHEHEVRFEKTEAGMVPVPETTRKVNPHAQTIKTALTELAVMLEPVPSGHRIRILVAASDDTKKDKDGKPIPDGNAHLRIEMDLIRS